MQAERTANIREAIAKLQSCLQVDSLTASTDLYQAMVNRHKQSLGATGEVNAFASRCISNLFLFQRSQPLFLFQAPLGEPGLSAHTPRSGAQRAGARSRRTGSAQKSGPKVTFPNYNPGACGFPDLMFFTTRHLCFSVF